MWVPLGFEKSLVAVMTVHVPAEEGIGGAPRRIGRALPPDMGNGICDGPLFVLNILNISDEFGVERAHIEIHHGLLRCEVGISQPPHALVSLVAVGGDAVEVRFLPPNDQMVQTVQGGIGTGKASDLFDGCMNDLTPECVQGRHTWETGQLYIAETVVGEPGRVFFLSFSLENIHILCPSRPKVFLIDHAVFVQQFGMPQDHFFTSRTGHTQY